MSTSASNSGRLFREMIKYRTFLISSLFVKNIIFNYLKKKFKLFDSVHGFKENITSKLWRTQLVRIFFQIKETQTHDLRATFHTSIFIIRSRHIYFVPWWIYVSQKFQSVKFDFSKKQFPLLFLTERAFVDSFNRCSRAREEEIK